jgi:hypothetical protein
MSFLESVTLKGAHAQLVPLSHDHHDDLIEAVRDGELWKLWYTTVPPPEGMRAEIEQRLALQAGGTALQFVVLDPASRKAIGLTSYLHADAVNRRLEIGATWYRASRQRSAFERATGRGIDDSTHPFWRCL